jgi:hypothetical protein
MMKCPKCGYVSFDYNLSCPKCGKDISSEQEKLNLPAFKPNPPLLLGALTGQAGEPSVELSAADSASVSFTREGVQSFDDSPLIDTGRGGLGSSEELDLSLEAGETKPIKDTGEFELETEEKALSDFDLDESASDELSLESDSLTLEQGTVDQDAVLGTGEKGPAEGEKEGDEIDLGSLELAAKGGAEEKGGIELKLDDLKINDTGDLEVGEKAAAAGEVDKPIDIDEITLDEIPLSEELTLEDASKEDEKKGKAEGSPEISADEGDAIDLDDLNLDIDVEEEPKQP